jgi:UDP-2,3-diacylglucosamine pyrophosphatase LpxH
MFAGRIVAGMITGNSMKRYRAGWISDVHLGTRGSQAAALLDFLKDAEFETLYLVGDLIDIWSLSAYVKAEVKNVVGFIGQFEESVVRYAKDFDVDGVLCGHIHTASVRKIGGIEYFNTGDWVESCTAIVEHYDGTMQLLRPEIVPPASEISDSNAPVLKPA